MRFDDETLIGLDEKMGAVQAAIAQKPRNESNVEEAVRSLQAYIQGTVLGEKSDLEVGRLQIIGMENDPLMVDPNGC